MALSCSRFLLVAWLALGLSACTSGPQPALAGSTAPPATASAVAMPDAASAHLARDILRRGGNAVDATVAAGLLLAVTYPEAGNIGGGGFMLLHVEGQDYFLDYREVAPAAATRDMFLDADGQVIEGLSLVGHRAAGVPGTVAGLWAAHQRFGTLPWADLVAPAVRAAADGFKVPSLLARRAADAEAQFAGATNFADYFGGLRRDQPLRQPQLAAVLERIADDGPAGFYGGTTARLIAEDMRRHGGLISRDDLANYHVAWREPLRARWRDLQIVSAPPPSSGGFAVIQLLKMKDRLAPHFAGVAHNSAQYVHLVAEMEKRVFADRAEYLGDPDFVAVPIAALVDDAYIAKRAAQVNPSRISTVAETPPGLEHNSTTHFSILDHWGNAVANTYTLNTTFGSGAVVEGAGFILNNQMDDFSVKPGVANFYGVVGKSANAVQPGKRMLSSMSPTILLGDDGVRMVLGTPGGSTIFTSVFQAVVNILDFGQTPAQAVSASRFHHQLLPPNLITMSPSRPLAPAVIEQLEQRGYDVQPHGWEFGDLQIIYRDADGVQAAADPRGRGLAGAASAPAP